MANHFCALVLFDCVCDMDHKSVINKLLLGVGKRNAFIFIRTLLTDAVIHAVIRQK